LAYLVAMSTLTLTMPTALQDWVDARIAEGMHADAADYLRDLVRRDRDMAAEDVRWVRAMIDEGLASGVVDQAPADVIEDIVAARRARRG
jgi:antitoxin ParD1/3/4